MEPSPNRRKFVKPLAAAGILFLLLGAAVLLLFALSFAGRLSLSVGTVPAKVPGGTLYQAYLYAREAAGLVKSFLVDWA